nr:hypothetical protein [Tanacetum cinerariifolium]
MKQGFFSQKESGRGKGVKEKDLNRNLKNTSSGISVSMDLDDVINVDTPSGVASVVQKGVTPSVVDITSELLSKARSFPGKSSYANITGKLIGKKLNIHTLFTSEGNGIDVVVSVESIRAIIDMYMQSWGRSSYARVMIELRADVKLKDNVFQPVFKKFTANTCGKINNPETTKEVNKKKGVEPTIEVSNLNPFDVLNSVDNDVEFGTNEGTTNLINNRATSSGSSFMNFKNDGEFASNTPIGEKIDKIEWQICKGKLRLLDNEGNSLVLTGIVESDSEVEVVFDETADLRIST